MGVATPAWCCCRCPRAACPQAGPARGARRCTGWFAAPALPWARRAFAAPRWRGADAPPWLSGAGRAAGAGAAKRGAGCGSPAGRWLGWRRWRAPGGCRCWPAARAPAASLAWFMAYAMQGAAQVRMLGMVEVVFGDPASRRLGQASAAGSVSGGPDGGGAGGRLRRGLSAGRERARAPAAACQNTFTGPALPLAPQCAPVTAAAHPPLRPHCRSWTWMRWTPPRNCCATPAGGAAGGDRRSQRPRRGPGGRLRRAAARRPAVRVPPPGRLRGPGDHHGHLPGARLRPGLGHGAHGQATCARRPSGCRWTLPSTALSCRFKEMHRCACPGHGRTAAWTRCTSTSRMPQVGRRRAAGPWCWCCSAPIHAATGLTCSIGVAPL